MNFSLLDFAEKDTTISVSPDEVRVQLENQISYFVKEVGSVGALEGVFGMPLKQIKESYWFEVYNSIMIDRYRYFLLSGLSVGKKEVENYYNYYKLLEVTWFV